MFVVRSHGTSALKIAVRNLPFESREPELGRFIRPAVYFFVFFLWFSIAYSEMSGVDEWHSDVLFLINFMLVWVIILITFYMFFYELFR